MKDIRGACASAVRSAILKEFGLQIPNSRKTSINISDWKGSKRVKECYDLLYADNENAVENIARKAFATLISSQGDDDNSIFNDIYVYTAAVCDIILNPKYPDVECSKKPLERRFKKFKVIFSVN